MTDPNVTIDFLGGNCPVQAEGAIDGHTFYFRARGSHWSMEISGGTESLHTCLFQFGAPEWQIVWEYDERWGDWPDAGWMDDKDAIWLIHRAAMLYRQHKRANAQQREVVPI